MPTIPIENEVKNLSNFLQSYDENDKFKEFANLFIAMIDENKSKINVNDTNQINDLIMQNRSKENIEFIFNSLVFVDDLANKGVINYKNLPNEINKTHNEVELNKTLDLIAEQIKQQNKQNEKKQDYSKLESDENKPKNETKPPIIDDEIEQISQPKPPVLADDEQEKARLGQVLEYELQANADLRSATIPVNEILDNPNYKKSEISPNEVIGYIKDDKQIYYPFDMNKTLDNNDFMRDFHGKIKMLNNNEIKELISHLRAKNEALRKIINAQEPDNEKAELSKNLSKELEENKELNKQADETIKRKLNKWVKHQI